MRLLSWRGPAALLAMLALGCGTRRAGFEPLDETADDAATAFDATSDAPSDADLVADAGLVGPPPIHFMQQDAASAGTSDCAHDATAYVFVLSSTGDLYRFAPDLKVFTKIGPLGCVDVSVPNSMAVDRQATAWVNYLDGTVRAVNTADAGCEGRTINMPSGWDSVGMGFASSDAGSASEALYVAGFFDQRVLRSRASGSRLRVGHLRRAVHRAADGNRHGADRDRGRPPLRLLRVVARPARPD